LWLTREEFIAHVEGYVHAVYKSGNTPQTVYVAQETEDELCDTLRDINAGIESAHKSLDRFVLRNWITSEEDQATVDRISSSSAV